MRDGDQCCRNLPAVEMLEGRTLSSVSPSLAGQWFFPTHTALKVEAGTLGEPITFDVTVSAASWPTGPLELYYHGKPLQALTLSPVPSSDSRLHATEATYTIPGGPATAVMFGIGLHAVRARFTGTLIYGASAAVAVFRVKRPQFLDGSDSARIATLISGSGPALQPGQTATVQYNAYVAADFRLFYSTESQMPDTQSFVVDANPEQVIPGLDAGVLGMQAGETRAIYIPRSLSRGIRGGLPAVQPRANLVYLVTLVSIT
jgi:hypothetical protein